MTGFEWSSWWFLIICGAIYLDGKRKVMPEWLGNVAFIFMLIVAAEFGYYAGAAGVIGR